MSDDDKNRCAHCGGNNGWHEEACRTQRPANLAQGLKRNPGATLAGSIDAAKAYTDERIDKLREVAVERFRVLAARVEELEEQIGAAKHDAAIARAHTEVLSENLGDRVRYLEESHKGVAVPLYNVQREQGLHLEALDSHSDRIAKLEERVARLATGGDVYTMRLALQECHDRLCKIENRGLASVQAGQCPHGWGDGCTDCDDANENNGPIGEPAQPIAGEYSGRGPGQTVNLSSTTGSEGATPSSPSIPIAIEVGQVWQQTSNNRCFRVTRFAEGRPMLVSLDGHSTWMPTYQILRGIATLVEPAPKTEEEPEPTTTVLPARPDVVLNGVFVSHPKHWAANVPEPPPVQVLLRAARQMEDLDVCPGSFADERDDVAAFLRAVAKAMEGGK